MTRVPSALFPADTSPISCAGWSLHYTGESAISVFSSTDGVWEEAPQRHVHSLEIEWAPPTSTTKTKGPPYYFFDPVIGYPTHTWEAMSHVRRSGAVKFGAWVHPDILAWAQQEGALMVSQAIPWVIFYKDGSYFLPSMGPWASAPLDEVVLAVAWRDDRACCIQACDYYFWSANGLTTSNDFHEAVIATCPFIKLAEPCLVKWSIVRQESW